MKKANNKSLISCLFSVLMLALTLSIMNPVTVEAAVKLNKTEATVKVGKTTKLKIKGAKGAKVKWSSSKKKIATVSNKGVVTGKKPGKTTIKAKVSGKTYKCQLSVLCKRHKYIETTVPATAEHCAYKCKKCKVCGHETDKKDIPPQITEAEAQAKLRELEAKYPTESSWTINNTYMWNGKLTRGCEAFAAMMSDAVFGADAPMTRHNNLYDIKIGDVIAFMPTGAQTGHAGIVIARNGDDFILASGNNGGWVVWGWEPSWNITSKITSATTILPDSAFPTETANLIYIITRYQ